VKYGASGSPHSPGRHTLIILIGAPSGSALPSIVHVPPLCVSVVTRCAGGIQPSWSLCGAMYLLAGSPHDRFLTARELFAERYDPHTTLLIDRPPPITSHGLSLA
jgi:hypothetical protein